MPDKRIDNGWGALGYPLLPRALRVAWASETIPGWVAAELGLAAGASAAALDESVWQHSSRPLSNRVRNYILNLVAMRRFEIKPLQLFDQPWPYWFDPNELSLSTRTRNCLGFAGLLADRGQLSKVSFGKLFEIRSMGVVSILEFACTAETALSKTRDSVTEPPVSEDELLALVSEPWADQIGPTDPRFSDLIFRLEAGDRSRSVWDSTIIDILDSVTSGPDLDKELLLQLTRSAPEFRDRTSKIRALSLEKQLSEFFQALSHFKGERLSAMLDRFGWAGAPPITLEEAGTRLGITRERVRQIQEKITSRLKEIGYPIFMPALDQALELLQARCPLSVVSASALLKEQGLSQIDFHPSSIIEAAKGCGRNPPICLQTVGKRTVVTTTDIPNADGILHTAYRQAQASGASNIAEVVTELDAKKIRADATNVYHTLREFSEVEFLEDNWFSWRPKNPERDRLRNVARKMLSVASPIELGTIREGVRREYRYRGYRGISRTCSLIVPPRSVLRKYFERHPEFTIDETDLVKPVEPLDYRTELALNDAILVDALRSSPACVLDRASLWNECARRSMNVNTFATYLSYSSTIIHLGTDVWSLRGVRIDPAAVETVRQANALREKERRVLDHGWTADGRLWVATRLPAAHSGGFVFGIPGAIKRYVSGRDFSGKDEDGIPRGIIRINDEGASYGFGPFLRQRGADEGDILVTEFNLEHGEALLRLGNDELLEEISPET
jgi:hypothetical protein